MISNSYPMRNPLVICILIITMLTWVSACKKENNQSPPSLHLIAESGYISDSAVVAIGFTYTIGIMSNKGDAAITNLVVTLTTENGTETALDSGMYSDDFSYSRSIAYGASRFEKWSFFTRDKNGKSATTSITILKDSTSAFGPITLYSSVVLGTQNNLDYNSFFSLSGGISYTKSDADSNQTDINIITYFGDLLVPSTEFTLSSPGESDVTLFYPFISNWALPRNETRYKPDSLSINAEAFNKAYNDSIIITNYTSATIGKRKFKVVRAGYVIPFQISAGPNAGKRGLISIKSLQNDPGGYVIADIKVQK